MKYTGVQGDMELTNHGYLKEDPEGGSGLAELGSRILLSCPVADALQDGVEVVDDILKELRHQQRLHRHQSLDGNIGPGCSDW